MEKQRQVKVTLQIPYRALVAFDEVSKGQLGIGRNAFFTIAAARLTVILAGMLATKKRATLLKELEEELQQVFAKAGKAA